MRVITIGRSVENDVVIQDPYATRHHLQIIQHDDGHFSLADFGSTNGTFINGQKIRGEVDLYENDVVRIGNTTIPWRLYFEEEEEQEVLLGLENKSNISIDKFDVGNNVINKESEKLVLSTTKASIILLGTMSLPLIIIIAMGAWVFIGRLVVSLIFALFAIIYSKKADKKARDNDVEKSIKAAKNAKGFNIVQIIYGVFSWLTLISALLSLS